MKQIGDMTLETARKRFRRSIVILVLAVIYLISPIDLIPGPPPVEWVEDIPMLIAAVFYSGYSYYRLKRQRSSES